MPNAKYFSWVATHCFCKNLPLKHRPGTYYTSLGKVNALLCPQTNQKLVEANWVNTSILVSSRYTHVLLYLKSIYQIKNAISLFKMVKSWKMGIRHRPCFMRLTPNFPLWFTRNMTKSKLKVILVQKTGKFGVRCIWVWHIRMCPIFLLYKS